MNYRGTKVPYYKISAHRRLAKRDIFFFSSSVVQHVAAELRDFTFAKNSISECMRLHDGTCTHDGLPDTSLRVIDCASRALCKIVPGAPYVCLSYVWGIADIAKNDCTKLPKVLPKTIEDSIWVTLQLGIPYLWVDRYCINQQNAIEKHQLITNMDTIYRGAVLTIIAAAGDGPDNGLPGIDGTPRRQCYSHIVGNDGREIIGLGVSSEIQNSVWNTRGWTYQEVVLSRRRLVFTASQMYFQCNAMFCIESLSSHGISSASLNLSSNKTRMRLSHEILVAFPNLSTTPTPRALYKQIEEYCPRRLSFDNDIIKAFLGIINAFEMRHGADRICATHVYGLPIFYNKASSTISLPLQNGEKLIALTPISTFLHSLMWHVDHRTDEAYTAATDSLLYPSWSFASIKALWKSPFYDNFQYIKFEEYLGAFSYQDDLHVWVKDASGASSELNNYARAWSEEVDREILPAISIESWVHSCRDSVDSQASDQIPTLADLGCFCPDSLDSQSGAGRNLMAVYLGGTHVDRGRLKYLQATLLVVEMVDDSTWRRIGLLRSHYVPRTLSFLNHLKSGWCMRTLSLV
jgi:hypothetical protein